MPVPHWWPLKDRVRQHLRGLIRRHQTAQDMEWGTFGPTALTAILRRRNLTGRALPSETFYPLIWTETALFYEPFRDCGSAADCPDGSGASLVYGKSHGDTRDEGKAQRTCTIVELDRRQVRSV